MTLSLKVSPLNKNMRDNFTFWENIKYKLFGKYYIRVEFTDKGFTDICSIFKCLKYIKKYGSKAKITIQ